ncbi:MAG: hypothetical protein K0Q94_4844, partial [Paenibacillus sp.]|nr:hypothetical protein [Paenibacillus sp.]
GFAGLQFYGFAEVLLPLPVVWRRNSAFSGTFYSSISLTSPISPKKAKIAEILVPLSCEIRVLCDNSGNHTSALLQINVELIPVNLRHTLRLNKQITVFCSLYFRQIGKAEVNKGGLHLLFPIKWFKSAPFSENRSYKPLLFPCSRWFQTK